MTKETYIQYTTFGNYKNLTASKVKASPYFYWWFSLKLITDYMGLCADPAANRFKTNSKIQQVFKDSGDAMYEGDKYVAFATWWSRRGRETEACGD